MHSKGRSQDCAFPRDHRERLSSEEPRVFHNSVTLFVPDGGQQMDLQTNKHTLPLVDMDLGDFQRRSPPCVMSQSNSNNKTQSHDEHRMSMALNSVDKVAECTGRPALRIQTRTNS